MSKRSCEAAESVEDALLRMARVNCNLPETFRGKLLFHRMFFGIHPWLQQRHRSQLSRLVVYIGFCLSR